MNDQEFGDYIAELVSIRATLDPADFSNRVIALANLLTIDRSAQTEARVRRLFNTQDEVVRERDRHLVEAEIARHRPRAVVDLPEPECRHGYPIEQVQSILGAAYQDFWAWMRGQTMTLCEAKECDRPHGGVVYRSDLLQYLAGGQPLD